MNEPLFPRLVRIALAVTVAALACGAVYVIQGGDPLKMSRPAVSSRAAGGQALFLLLALVLSVVAHQFIRYWLLASAAAAAVFTTVVQIIGYLSLGYLHKFFPIALITGGFFGFAVASVTAVPFVIFCQDRKPDGGS